MRSPCYQCQKRTLTCHGVCKEYLEWKKENDERRRLEGDRKHRIPERVIHYIWKKSRWH